METLQLIYALLIVGCLIVVITENHNPRTSISWILALLFLPVLGLLLYFIFGKDHRYERIISDEEKGQLMTLAQQPQAMGKLSENHPYHGVSKLLQKASDSPVLSGNRVKVFTLFSEMMNNMMSDISRAKHHVHVQFFKIEDDPVGRALAELLIHKAGEGVEVRLMYDDAANIMVNRNFYKYMSDNGVLVQSFLKVHFPFIDRDINCRNHKKIVVIDGIIGYTGGMNVAERYEKGIKIGIWRDTHIRVEGPVVAQLQVSFLSDWRFSTGKLLADAQYFAQTLPFGDIKMQIISSGPKQHWQLIMQGMVQAIALSKHYIYIQSPYFLPTEPLLMALRNAALSGVDVRLMIPYRGDDGQSTMQASHSFLQEILEVGVKVYSYQKGYMHAKVMVFDDECCTIGSTNIDFRSLEQDFEVNAFIYDKSLSIKMKEIFLEDEKDCLLIEPEAWQQRPRLKKIRESLARLISPLL